MTELSTIVVAYGDDERLGTCLDAIDRARGACGAASELVVVLNRAAPERRRRLQAREHDATLVEPSTNLGFAAGVVAALDRARGEFAVLVNDDCVVEPDAFAELLAAARSAADVGSVAAQVRFARRPGILNSAGLEVDELGVATERLLGLPIDRGEAETVEVFGASGALALYRRAMLDDVGGLDVSFFAYLEDADLAWRARMHGWRCLYAPRAIGHHDHSPALGHGSAAKDFLVGRNRVRMLAKNATRARLLRRGPAILAYDLALVGFAAVRHGTLAPLRGRWRGLREWPRYRALGAAARREVELAARAGFRQALRRNRVYASL